ncbi:amidohydrolase family protein [Roseomonas elaeocarpi]|uniref:Amidohydrolase family protein n=1 Tax=Roseomonas elaeocarpi TaxID=907779 RepID=A0ABV6JR96_9PROT
MNIAAPMSPVTDRIAVIDADFHPMPVPSDPQVAVHMSQRWRDYIAQYGMGFSYSGLYAPAQREFTHRLDAVKDSRVGIDPLWAKEQVLDPFDMSGVVLTCPQSYILNSGGNMPVELSMELARAFNNALAYTWMAADPRYYAAIVIPRDLPNVAAEIRRCKEGEYGDRFVSVLMSPAGQEPLGRQRYWEIFEACTHYNLPITFHVPGMGRQITAAGNTNFYGEMHMNFASLPMTLVPSLIFEGVFERFPSLRVALIELGWSWAVPYSWRLDAAWTKLRGEVPHLRSKPSDYMRKHFWFTTQPIEEPERLEDTESVYEMLEESGFADRLMFSSDYPHWDFDSPYESVPETFPLARRRRMLGQNASQLFGIPLKPGSGIRANASAG